MNTHRKITPTSEPALTIGAIAALVGPVIALLVVLGVDVPTGLEAALVAVITAAAPIVAAILIRARVTPTQDVVERRDGGDVVAGGGHDTIVEGEKIRDVFEDA